MSQSEVDVDEKGEAIRHRNINSDENQEDSDDGKQPLDDKIQSNIECNLTALDSIPQGTDHIPSFLATFLELISPKFRNYIVRFIFTWAMLAAFFLIVYMGPFYMVLLVMVIELMCFREIIKIGYLVYRAHDLPWFRVLSWAFLVTSNYFLFGESNITKFRILLTREDFLSAFVDHHRFISFLLYCGCVVGFVLSLKKKHYLKQFILFGWTHVTLLFIVTSSHCIIQNIFNGIIWFLVPTSMIICNDIMAYMFGFFFGRTPLIKLSPKKTWEGFIGGAISTLIFSFLFSWFLIKFDSVVCPLEYDDVKRELSLECQRNPVFLLENYNLSDKLRILKIFLPNPVRIYPYFFHCFWLALFASIVGPFGGFFASGFKRAFKIKDFGDVIPGHGGIMDRFDCQVLMGFFTFVYYHSFIKVPGPEALLKQIYVLPREEQLNFYNLLTEGLQLRGVLPT